MNDEHTPLPYELHYESPLGTLRLLADESHLTHIYWPQHKGAIEIESQPGEGHQLLQTVVSQLDSYFAGELKEFDVPMKFQGTPFQREVWSALQTIPWGQTWSYGELAQAIGRPSAVRAVGAANGRNPLSILVPCHRVIGSDGSLTGYAGGVENKRWLLRHEGVLGPEAPSAGLEGHHGEQLSLIGP